MIFYLVTKHYSSRDNQKTRAFSSLSDNLHPLLFLIQEIFRALMNDRIWE